MSRHTVCCAASRRVIVQPSRLATGSITLEIQGADRSTLATVTLDAGAAGALLVGIEAAELSARVAKDREGYAAEYVAKYAPWAGAVAAGVQS